VRRFFLAVRFLTIVPLWRGSEVNEGDITGSVSYFPLVGAVQGIILVSAFFILRHWFSGLVLSTILVALLTLTNGGFHLDGFMDTVDGLAGGGERERRLAIMSDPNAGAVGVVFTFFIIILKIAALDAMPINFYTAALFLWPVFGRWATVPLALSSNYARPEGGLGKAITAIGAREFFIATGITLVISFYWLGPWAFLILVLTGALAYIVSLFFKSRLGGVTGDVFGFQAELSEVLFLLLLLSITR
jgi:adenosylcobinamide-GDP ribazoletransferase